MVIPSDYLTTIVVVIHCQIKAISIVIFSSDCHRFPVDHNIYSCLIFLLDKVLKILPKSRSN